MIGKLASPNLYSSDAYKSSETPGGAQCINQLLRRHPLDEQITSSVWTWRQMEGSLSILEGTTALITPPEPSEKPTSSNQPLLNLPEPAWPPPLLKAEL